MKRLTALLLIAVVMWPSFASAEDFDGDIGDGDIGVGGEDDEPGTDGVTPIVDSGRAGTWIGLVVGSQSCGSGWWFTAFGSGSRVKLMRWTSWPRRAKWSM